MAIILVEGPDGAGKTTFIEKARGNQKSRYFIRSQASRYQPNIPSALKYLNWIRSCPLDLILDRFHFLSDRVYGPILRNEDVFKGFPLNFGIQKVDLIVYCRPPLETIRANVERDSHLSGVQEHIEALVNSYDSIMRAITEQQITKVIQYDFTTDDPIATWNYVWSEVNRARQ